MTQRTIGDKRNVKLTGDIDKTVSLVKGLEGRVFCLDSVDLSDYEKISIRAPLYQ